MKVLYTIIPACSPKVEESHPRCGYRRITALLRREGFRVNKKQVQRIWRTEGLKVGRKPCKRRRGSTDAGSRRQRGSSRNHVWSYDFVLDQTEDGRRLKMLPVIDEYTREYLAVKVERHLTAVDIIGTLDRLFKEHGAPQFIRSDNVLPTKASVPQRQSSSMPGGSRFSLYL